MKNSDNLSKLSNEALLKTLKNAKNQFIGFMIFFVLLVVGCNYFTITKGFGIYTMVPVIFIPIIIANIFNYGKIKQEAKIRKLM
ncbi:hypothetical protein [Epilithonimonas lactis]|uniref:Redox-active disulfide protein 2 n=1 Tax=Epilithonimonas lactis TaxID=421072 RepID=A0A085BHU9_9FLAO|nr:hypothetical protein [Epilithonimonas lactis]KFC22044.1 hypothetical protein IO89_08765 [Epilithonimonas lactis]WDF46524.1 hypothetical protein PQ459_16680 [Chryseobacterium sp. KACC 21268]SEQ52725.1 hypothetical protein SAMN04488097_2367 [Epilithonimonas lactis]